jgi:hypothetical protein
MMMKSYDRIEKRGGAERSDKRVNRQGVSLADDKESSGNFGAVRYAIG